jgi:dTDP-4-amino-4,6-dideoxygalactose transaminase
MKAKARKKTKTAARKGTRKSAKKAAKRAAKKTVRKPAKKAPAKAPKRTPRKAAAKPPASIPLLDLSRAWPALERTVLAEVKTVFRENDFILGKRVAKLEGEIAAHAHVPYAVGCASGTDALLLSLLALGVGPGHEVITTPYTFFATAGAIWNRGARPVFVDIDPDTFNIDPRAAAAAMGPRTRAMIPVHLFGRCADMVPILAATTKHHVAVVEDMAQAIGAEYRGFRAGSMGDTGTLSFYPSKNLGGAGDGGMVLTCRKDLDARLRLARNHGMAARYRHHFVGTNSRLDGLQAAVLRAKLKKVGSWSAARAANAKRYDRLLKGMSSVRTPAPVPKKEGRHVYNQYTIRCERRDALKEHLAKAGIGTAVYYPLPLHLQPCFSGLGYREGAFPHAERASREALSLPVFPELKAAEVERVAAAIRGFYGE